MKPFTSTSLLAALYATAASADPASHCPNGADNICFQVAIPESSASSGTGNIYFQISAPDSYSWVGLATGSRMNNANMFIMYADGDGNVTISPRQASGHVMPTVANDGADLELLDGSGIQDGVMTANVRCSNCHSWKSQTLDFSGDSSSWVAAWNQGSAIDSASVDASITQHDTPTGFNIDLTQATISDDSNPFAGDSASPSPSGGNNSSDDGGAVTDDDDNAGVSSNVLLAHGVIMTVVFVVLYPLGSILMPLLGKWFVHAGWQLIALLLMWAAFALGFVYARDYGYLFNQSHTILGTVVVVLITLQPFTGFVHHNHYKKHQARNIVSHTHIWYGRLVLALGIINGGFGLRLANSSNAWVIAYAVIAAIMTVAYIAALVFKKMRGKRREKQESGSTSSPREPEQGKRANGNSIRS